MVRHGETECNRQGVATGWIDTALTEVGEKQADACRMVITAAGITPRAIVCTGLSRTRKTAEVINRDFNLPIEVVADLNEQKFGEWEGMPWCTIEQEMERTGPDPVGGESGADFSERVLNAFQQCLRRFPSDTLYVTHRGIFDVLAKHYNISLGSVSNANLYRFTLRDDLDPDSSITVQHYQLQDSDLVQTEISNRKGCA